MYHQVAVCRCLLLVGLRNIHVENSLLISRVLLLRPRGQYGHCDSPAVLLAPCIAMQSAPSVSADWMYRLWFATLRLSVEMLKQTKGQFCGLHTEECLPGTSVVLKIPKYLNTGPVSRPLPTDIWSWLVCFWFTLYLQCPQLARSSRLWQRCTSSR